MYSTSIGAIISRPRENTEYETLVNTGYNFPVKGDANCYNEFPLDLDLNIYDQNKQLGASYFTGVAQAIYVESYEMFSISFNIRRVNTPTGNLYVRVYYATGTYGSTAVPGNMLFESNPINVTTLAQKDADDVFETKTILLPNGTFGLLEQGTSYMISFEYSGGDASNYLELAVETDEITTNGNAASKTTGSWSASTSFQVPVKGCGAKNSYDWSISYSFNNVTSSRTYGSGGVQRVGFSFTATGSQTIYQAAMFLKTVAPAANTTGTLNIEIYNSVSNQPGTTLIGASDNRSLADVRSIYDPFVFYFTTPVSLTSGTTYTAVLVYKGGTLATDISIAVGQDNTTSSYSGNSFYQNQGSSTWVNESSTIDNCFMLGIVTLTEALFDSYDPATFGDQYNYLASGENTRIAQSFTGVNGLFSKITVELRKTGSPTGNLTAKLYDHTGTYGTTGTPTGTALATSDALSVSTISTTSTQYTITFSGANQYQMTDGTYYWISLEYSGGSTTNKIGVVMDISSPTASGRAAYYNGTSWTFTDNGNGTSGTTDDMCYFIYALQ